MIKSTLRPSLTCPFKPKHSEIKFTDFVVKLEELPSKILTESKLTLHKNSGKKNSCRCGNATPTPGKLTCGGQRCPCYISAKACTACKCKGCRNPHQVNGIKVVRPHLTMQVQNQNTTNNSKYFISTQNSTSKSLTTIRRIHLNWIKSMIKFPFCQSSIGIERQFWGPKIDFKSSKSGEYSGHHKLRLFESKSCQNWHFLAFLINFCLLKV